MASIPTHLLLLCNDQVQACFSDGSRLQLSPCGSVFVCETPPNPAQHALQGVRRVQQRTRFVTSEFRSRVLQALEFRNRFCERPYLCQELVEKDRVVNSCCDLTQTKWPSTLTNNNNNTTTQDTGSVTVTSLDNLATLCLAPHGKEFTVTFLCRINCDLQMDNDTTRSSGSNNHQNVPNSSLRNRYPMKDDKLKTPGNNDIVETSSSCTWVMQHHSVDHCPEYWTHPLKLALYGHKMTENEGRKDSCKATFSETFSDGQKEGVDREGQEVVTGRLPSALPLSCKSSHLHQWAKPLVLGGGMEEGTILCQQQGVKVCALQGVLYRLLWGGRRCVEVYPGDGSVLVSQGVLGHFFHHYKYKPATKQFQQQVLCVSSLPPDLPGDNYSTARLVCMAARLLEHSNNLVTSGATVAAKCCWKDDPSADPTPPLPSMLLEESEVAGLGRFQAYSDGRVHVVFEDRTVLDTVFDFSGRVQRCKRHSPEKAERAYDAVQRSITRGSQCSAAGQVCRLLLPNGQYCTVPQHAPGHLHRYVQAAVEWAGWVRCTTQERADFYRGTVYDPEKKGAIAAELSKIKCFNYILENAAFPWTAVPARYDRGRMEVESATTHPSHLSAAGIPIPSDSNPTTLLDIAAILKMTSQAIEDINVLQSKRKDMRF
ncbi:C5orf34 [Branchiostoma lanceolatum]|nr:C5orf34 [Branchiostoma lanceolatum]